MGKYKKNLKARADSGDKTADDILIHSYVESLIEPVIPMLAMRVKTIMEEVFEQTKKKYEQAGQSKIARYEDVLRFYAEKKNYRKAHLNGRHVNADNGETARKVLEENKCQ